MHTCALSVRAHRRAAGGQAETRTSYHLGVIRFAGRACLALAFALVVRVDARQAPAAADGISRLEAFALMQTLNAELLASRSATATLEGWCRDRRLAPEPRIVAQRVDGVDKPVTAEQRQRLDAVAGEPLKYRRVQLRCGTHVLSEADNWYVPSRLTPEMNRLLDATDTPFGRAVASLEPYRRTHGVTLLWRPADSGAIPDRLFEHRAVLYTRDHRPFSEVVEVYQRAVIGAASVTPLMTQPTPPTKLDARASDPVTMGWMAGSPPPADKLVRFADDSWYRFPQSRWAFSNIRQLMPTSVVRRGQGPVMPLARAERSDIDAITFMPIGGTTPMTWAESLDANYTDGILILHRGRIIYERYFGVLAADRQHLAFSVTKSFVATLAATLIAEGVIDALRTVGSYVPELATTGVGDATIRQVLDMTTGLAYTEDYVNSKADPWELSRAGGFMARPADYSGPETFFDYLKTLEKASPHGQQFSYKTVNTDTLGAVLKRVTGKSVTELLSERVFSQLGAEQDAFFTVDSTGVEFAGGGLNLTLRDLARFGEAMRLGGRYYGRQIIPTAVVDDIQRGGDRDKFTPAGYKTLPGWSYRTMWWVSHNEHGAYMARGVHGQALYIDPKAEMVIARFASHPLAANVNLDPTSLPAYHAVARQLIRAR